MREKKYANVVSDVEIANESESADKLSMTRELKFKDLQMKIDEEIGDSLINEELKENDDNSDDISLSKNDNKYCVDGQPNSKKVDDDIYLTTSFKPFKKRFKLRKVFKIMFEFMLVIVVLLSLYFLAFLPLYNKYLSSKPQAIFNNTVDSIGNGLVKLIEDNVVDDDKLYFDINFKINSNYDELYYLSNYNYGYQISVEPKLKTFNEYIYLNDGDSSYGINYFEKDSRAYLNYSTSENILDMGELDSDATEEERYYNDILEMLKESKTNKSDLIYYIEKNVDIIKRIYELADIAVSNDELEINGEIIKVKRNSWSFDNVSLEKALKMYEDFILDDEKLLDISAEFNGMTIDEYKEYLGNMENQIEEEHNECINIYTIKGNKFVGLDEEENGFRLFYFYIYNGDFEMYLNFTENEECLNGKDCVLDNQRVISMNGLNNDSYTEVDIKYNNDKIGTLNVRDFTYDKINIEYDFSYDDNNFKGDLLVYKNENYVYDIDLSYRCDAKYIDAIIKVSMHGDSKDLFENRNIIDASDKNIDDETNDFLNKLNELGLGDGYITWSDFLSTFFNSLVLDDEFDNNFQVA